MNVNVVFLSVSFVNIVVGQQTEGDLCFHETSNLRGICTNILNCPEELNTIKQGAQPQRCGFDGLHPIICCVEPRSPTEISTEIGVILIETGNISTETEDITTETGKILIETGNSSTETEKISTQTGEISRQTGQISNEKCKEYSQYLWNIELNPLLFIGGSDIVRHDCPFNREELVVGGKAATRREFPHMVHLGYALKNNETVWACGGSLISDQFVLTAAHCLDSRTLQTAKFARMGITDQEEDDHIQVFDIIGRIPYPEYHPQYQSYDIGLVKLNRKAKLNTWVRPACLYTNNFSPRSTVIASGWGDLFSGGDESQILQKVVLEVYGIEQCGKVYKKNKGLRRGIDDRTMICAGSSMGNKDTCQGDSGGPLQIYKEKGTNMSCMYDIVGITSFGVDCAIGPDVPSVYTRVSYFIKWIEDIVWPLAEN